MIRRFQGSVQNKTPTPNPHTLMTPEEQEQLRAHLQHMHKDMLEQGHFVAAPNRRDHVAVPDEDEQPLNEMEQVIASNRNKQRTAELAAIERAMERLARESEDFGLCEQCDNPIPLGRLKIKPWASHCVKCLNANDPKHRSTRRRHIFDYMD